MEMIGLPKDYLVTLLKAALFGEELDDYTKKQALDHLKRLCPKPSKQATFPKPTGTAEKIDVNKQLDQASSIGATPSWTVGKANG
jgi:hypothetical protein